MDLRKKKKKKFLLLRMLEKDDEENMLFLLQHFFYLFVGKLGENQRNEEELVKNAVFWLPCSESLVVTKG